MKVELTNVTPDMAADFLSRNANNRSLSRNRVLSLAAAMRSGKWQVNGETVIISEDNRLLDGQHRLKAVIQYGQPVSMLIAYGAKDEAFTTIDTGKTRSHGDILSMAMVKNPTAVAASARLVWQLLARTSMLTACPPAYIIEVVDRFPSLQKWANKTGGMGVKTIVPQSSFIAALVYLEDIAKKPATAEAFFKGIIEGANLGEGSPLLALRNRMINERASNGRMDARHVWPVVAKALTYFEASQKVSKLKMVQSGGVCEAPDLLDIHMESLTPSQRLLDLLPPESKHRV